MELEEQKKAKEKISLTVRIKGLFKRNKKDKKSGDLNSSRSGK